MTLAQRPLATYGVEITDLAATRPTRGQRITTCSTAATRYRAYLARKQSETAARVGVKPVGRQAVALNGLAARLTSNQTQTVARTKGVLAVSKERRRQLTDDQNSTDFLRPSGPDGVWSSLAGTSQAGRGDSYTFIEVN